MELSGEALGVDIRPLLRRLNILKSEGLSKVKDIAVGEGVYYAANCDGNVYCWKRNEKSGAISSIIQLDETQ